VAFIEYPASNMTIAKRLSDLSRGAHFWATARLNQISPVLSGVFNDGDVLEGVRFVDPFARACDLSTVGYSKSE
jgi:hypothetical protein